MSCKIDSKIKIRAPCIQEFLNISLMELRRTRLSSVGLKLAPNGDSIRSGCLEPYNYSLLLQEQSTLIVGPIRMLHRFLQLEIQNSLARGNALIGQVTRETRNLCFAKIVAKGFANVDTHSLLLSSRERHVSAVCSESDMLFDSKMTKCNTRDINPDIS